MAVVDIARDGDTDSLRASLRSGLLVIGTIERARGGVVDLHVDEMASPTDALQSMAFAAEVRIDEEVDTVATINALPNVQCTLLSGLIDELGLTRILRRGEHLGTSWRSPGTGATASAEPTFAWTRQLAPGRIDFELALFLEYEELVVLLRPLQLIAA